MKFHSEKIKNFFAAFIVIFSLACCHNYYKASKIATSPPTERTVDSLKQHGRYFILRDGKKAFYMNNIVMSDNRKVISCTLDSLPDNHKLYLTYARKGRMLYKKSNPADKGVLNEVHFFIDPAESTSVGNYTLQLDKVQKIEVIEKDKSRTTVSYILGGLGITAGAIAVSAIIFAASLPASAPPPTSDPSIGCSPQLYSLNNNGVELNGTLCSGAIYASLARTDYLPVNKLLIDSGKLSLILRGAINEELMMKDFMLIEVAHSANQHVLIDKNGRILDYAKPVSPEHAFIGNGNDVVKSLSYADEDYYSFTNETQDGASYVLLDFKKPLNASSGKLIIKGKNSEWAYYVFNEFKKLYGKYYQSLIQKKDKQDPSTVLQCAIDQSLPLLVSVNDGDGWKLVDYFFTPGKASPRELIMQLNLENFKQKDRIQVRLQTAYRFWDIDYTAMDFSNQEPISVSYIAPSQSYKSGTISTQDQSSIDSKGYTLIKGDEQLHFNFHLSDSTDNTSRSYFLQSNGYYHDKTTFNTKPQFSELKKCSGKGAFDKFSRRKFQESLGAFNSSANTQKDADVFK